ncbi:orotate phosphoribosyltransferase, partial [Pseudoalteromonas sp. S1609]
IQQAERDLNTQVPSLVTWPELLSYQELQGTMDEHLAAVKAYPDQYGVA